METIKIFFQHRTLHVCEQAQAFRALQFPKRVYSEITTTTGVLAKSLGCFALEAKGGDFKIVNLLGSCDGLTVLFIISA